jgi:NitT/TauT family transport system ATP-binding protein
MSAPPTVAQAPNVAPAAAGEATKPPHVTIRGLSKSFDKTVIYDNFDLDIPRGELISVFGPNGCGKSTLINMIAGLVPTDAGQILFDDEDLRTSISATCSRIIARRCFPGCAPSTTSPIRSN